MQRNRNDMTGLAETLRAEGDAINSLVAEYERRCHEEHIASLESDAWREEERNAS